MDADDVFLETEDKMEKAAEFTLHEFGTLHTGKATPAMVEGVHVEVAAYGGSSMQIKELAAITTPDARTIKIQPWDKSVAQDIERGLQKANLGFNPLLEGGVLRIPLPELSQERRKELVKVSHNIAEEGRVRVRQARREALDALKKLEKKGEISEDDLKRYEKEVQEE